MSLTTYIKDLKPVAATYAFLQQIFKVDKYFLGSCLYERRDGTKSGSGW